MVYLQSFAAVWPLGAPWSLLGGSKGIGGPSAMEETSPVVAKTLPPMGSVESHAPSTPRAQATLPPQLDFYAPILEEHFRALQSKAGSTIYSTRISAACLHMHWGEDGLGYVALVFDHEFEPTLPIVRPHVSLAWGVQQPDWKGWWSLKHRLTTFLNERTITCLFLPHGSHADKLSLDDRSEWAVLCRMMQEEISVAQVPVQGREPLELITELHMTFHQMTQHTV